MLAGSSGLLLSCSETVSGGAKGADVDCESTADVDIAEGLAYGRETESGCVSTADVELGGGMAYAREADGMACGSGRAEVDFGTSPL